MMDDVHIYLLLLVPFLYDLRSRYLLLKKQNEETEMKDEKEDKPRKARLTSVPPDQLGLRLIVESTEEHRFDVIAVHGLGAIPSITWSKRGSQSWLADPGMLPKALPNARILQFGYDSIWFGKTPVHTSLDELALMLHTEMEYHARDSPKPFVMIGHCFGGLVIEKAYVLGIQKNSNLWQGYAGVVLLGTPHRGTALFDTQGELLKAIAKNADSHYEQVRLASGPKILDGLKSMGDTLGPVPQTFSQMAHFRGLRIKCFHEGKPSNVSRMVEGLNMAETIIVDQMSASLDHYHDSQQLITDHFGLNKFSDPNDWNYKTVCKAIKDLAQAVDHQTTSVQISKRSDTVSEIRQSCLDSLKFPGINARKRDIKNRHGKTCDWILDTKCFLQWRKPAILDHGDRILWIKGKAGTGKSTLMKYVHTYCSERYMDENLASYFFHARGEPLERSLLGMFLSLTWHLCQSDDELLSRLVPLYLENQRMYQNKWEWQLDTLRDFLELELKYQTKPIVILVDALDECNDEDVRQAVNHLETLVTNAFDRGLVLRVLLSSRHYPNITVKSSIELIVDKESGHIQDIHAYVKGKLHTDSPDIREPLLLKANGNFIWTVLIVELLNKKLAQGPVLAARKLVQDLPDDLDNLYTEMLVKDNANRGATVLMLQWLLFDRTYMSPEALYHAVLAGTDLDELQLAIQSDVSTEDIKRFITDRSKGLAEIRTFSDGRISVQLMHQSVRDFLLRHKKLQTLDSSLEGNMQGLSYDRLLQCCVRYLELPEIDALAQACGDRDLTNPEGQDRSLNQRYKKRFPFFFSVASIFSLAESAQQNGVDQEPLLRHFSSKQNFKRFTFAHDTISYGPIGGDANLLYALSGPSTSRLLEVALKRLKLDPNILGGVDENCLAEACRGHDEDTIRLLLDAGANPNIKSSNSTPLLTACEELLPHIAELLLKAGADVNSESRTHGSPLYYVQRRLGKEKRRVAADMADEIDWPTSQLEKLRDLLMSYNAVEISSSEFIGMADSETRAMSIEPTTALMEGARQETPAAHESTREQPKTFQLSAWSYD